MAEVAVGVDAVADQLLDLPGVGEAAIALALPGEFAVEMNLENAAGAGFSVTSPISRLKVESTSCALQAARSSQLHCVQ